MKTWARPAPTSPQSCSSTRAQPERGGSSRVGAGVIAGLALLPTIVQAYRDIGHIEVDATAVDGALIEPGDAVAQLSGPLRGLLAMERVALNFLGHLSGVATHTAAYADRIAQTKAKVYDTRKTLPGLRGVQKYAVACGGGGTHRMGLYDAVMVKDNHLAHVPPEQVAAAVTQMIVAALWAIRGVVVHHGGGRHARAA